MLDFMFQQEYPLETLIYLNDPSMEIFPVEYEGQIKAVDKFPSVCLNYEQSEWADTVLISIHVEPDANFQRI